MAGNRINRRDFVTGGALAAGALAGGLAEAQNRVPAKGGAPAPAKAPSTRSILNYNENMEYRRLGKTGLMVSAISLGGHWKRIEIEIGKDKAPARYPDSDTSYPTIPASWSPVPARSTIALRWASTTSTPWRGRKWRL